MNKIISILPYKEEFTQLGGAVAIGINEQLKHSIYKNKGKKSIYTLIFLIGRRIFL